VGGDGRRNCEIFGGSAIEKNIVLNDLSKPQDVLQLKTYLGELYRDTGGIYTTTAPNGNITANRNTIALYNNSGTYTVWINVDGGTTWQEISSSTEESTWTPAITFGGAAVGVTYSATHNTASYTKIGNRVFLSGLLTLTSKGSSNGVVLITGLPFTSKNDNSAFSGLGCGYINVVTYSGQTSATVNPNTSVIRLAQISEAGTYTQLTDANFADNSQIVFGGSYLAA